MRIFSFIHPGHLVFILFLAVGISFPLALEQALDGMTSWFATHFGWLVMLACSGFVVFAFYLAFSKYGNMKLGGAAETPRYSTFSWLAMLFAAGMGSGLIFYGAAEPLLHYLSPPPSAELITESAEKARRSMAITFFHWGIHAWAIYAMAALSIAYFTFHANQPMLPSAAITSEMRGVPKAVIYRLVDTLAILSVVFGLVATMSQVTLQLSEGITQQLIPDAPMLTVQLVLLALMFICYTISASTRISQGIRILSNINITIAILLMLFVLAVGPTLFILDSFVTAIGDYLDQFIALSFNLRPFSDNSGWTGSWSITYFLWWVSWGPFVGVFIARISRGRTIRQFVLGVILVPSVFSALWFSVFGGSALHLEIFEVAGFAGNAAPQGILFNMFAYFPAVEIMTVIALLLLFIFLITSADSGTYVLGMFTTQGNLNPPVWERLFWGGIIALVTVGAMLSGRSTDFFRSFAVVGSIPYLLVMIWQCACLWKKLKKDTGE